MYFCCCDIWIRSWRYWNKAASVPLPMLSRLASLFWCLANVTIHALQIVSIHEYLVVGLKYFLFSPLFGEMIQFDEHIFQMGWNHQPDIYYTSLWSFIFQTSRVSLLTQDAPIAESGPSNHPNSWSGVRGSFGWMLVWRGLDLFDQVTPRKTNMSPENQWWEMYFLLKYSLLRGHVSFPGCISTW